MGVCPIFRGKALRRCKVTLEWPRSNIFLTIQGGAEARDGATSTERGEGESAEGAEGDDGNGGRRKGEEEKAEETRRECKAAGG